MKLINVYYNYASKTSAGHIEVPDDTDIEVVIKEWIEQGFCKIHFHNNQHWIYVNWQNVVYVAYANPH